MKPKRKLSALMTPAQFENGYWYTTELKAFADTLGLPSAGKLRKDELEKAVRHFLVTGEFKSPTARSLTRTGMRDAERGLRLDLPVRVYTNDTQTKTFIEREAQKRVPGLKRRSGVRYRLNRWREEQLSRGLPLTYGGLVEAYVRLNQTPERFARIPHGRYINFLSDFLAGQTGATRAAAIKAWKALKLLDIPKDYPSWVRFQSKGRHG